MIIFDDGKIDTLSGIVAAAVYQVVIEIGVPALAALLAAVIAFLILDIGLSKIKGNTHEEIFQMYFRISAIVLCLLAAWPIAGIFLSSFIGQNLALLDAARWSSRFSIYAGIFLGIFISHMLINRKKKNAPRKKRS